MSANRVRSLACLLVVVVAMPALAQSRPDPKQLLAAQGEAMQKLSWMDGVWRGPAQTVLENGTTHRITQTERIGPFLGGMVRMIEGRGYDPDGTVSFNALGVVSYDPASKTYSIHSHAMGQKGDFALTPTESGYVWEIPAGPMIIRYTATVKDGKWNEVGDRVMPGKEPVRFFEMNLQRVSDTSWPAEGAVPAK